VLLLLLLLQEWWWCCWRQRGEHASWDKPHARLVTKPQPAAAAGVPSSNVKEQAGKQVAVQVLHVPHMSCPAPVAVSARHKTCFCIMTQMPGC
jgi:hypothetical protein